MDTQKDLSSLPATSSKPGGSVPPSCAVSSGSGARRTTATWTLELNCECPHCKEWVDLLDYADFWDAHSGSLEACEHGTKRSNGIEVTCPECTKDFEVDCEY